MRSVVLGLRCRWASRKPTTSPGAFWNDTPQTAFTGPYDLLRCEASIIRDGVP